MNNQTTIEKMKQMRLQGMAEYHYTNSQNHLHQEYTIDQYIALLIDQEWEYRQNKRMETLIAAAKFKEIASIKDIDYSAVRNLDKNNFERLASLSFIKSKENIIIIGATGTGKSYLAQALGCQSCISLYKTLYFNTSKLMEKVKIARLEGTYTKFLDKIEKCNLLILDDFGLFEFDTITRQVLMDIIESKYDKSSIIITSQIPVNKWHQLIGEGTIADAILDRIVYSSHRLNLEGESMRKNKMKN